MSGYNGWSNYATWRINLEVVDGMTIEDFSFNPTDVDTPSGVAALAEAIERYVDEAVLADLPAGLGYDLAAAMLCDVDWLEIAEHLASDALAEV